MHLVNAKGKARMVESLPTHGRKKSPGCHVLLVGGEVELEDVTTCGGGGRLRRGRGRWEEIDELCDTHGTKQVKSLSDTAVLSSPAQTRQPKANASGS